MIKAAQSVNTVAGLLLLSFLNVLTLPGSSFDINETIFPRYSILILLRMQKTAQLFLSCAKILQGLRTACRIRRNLISAIRSSALSSVK